MRRPRAGRPERATRKGVAGAPLSALFCRPRKRDGDPAGRRAGLWADRRGVLAVVFGLAIVPILLGVGAAVDISRALVVQHRLAGAIDAAGLGVATALAQGTSEGLMTIMQKYFDANYPAAQLGVPGALELTVSDNGIAIAATATVETTFMR
ncbi:MAG: TadE/TadG family type IV pilus assembly protein [Pseudomonadota bacterium]